MRIGLIQAPYPRSDRNVGPLGIMDDMLRQLEEVQEPHALIVLPEYANCPGLTRKDDLLPFVATHTPRFVGAVSRLAKTKGTAIAVNVLLREGGRLLNATLLIDRRGEQVFRYLKTHLSATEATDWQLAAGVGPAVCDWNGVRLGFLTCFEIYFAEYVERLAAWQPDLVIFPTYQRSEDADVIVKQTIGRALDLEAVVVRVSYALGPASTTGGHSLVVSPRGAIVLNAAQQPGLFSCTIDPHEKRLRPVAHGLPAARSRQIIENFRRPALYRPAGRGAVNQNSFPRVCAHRGLSGLCPENTLPAFGAAIALGVEEIELDVWASCDGELVVCHDETLDRTSNGQGRIRDWQWDDIRPLDGGRWFGNGWAGTALCRLRDVFEHFGGRVVMNLHLKESGPAGVVIRQTNALAQEFGLGGSIYIAGERDVLEWAKRIAPEIERCCLEGQGDGSIVEHALAFQCRRVQFWNPKFDDQHIGRAHQHGLRCNVFYTDHAEEARSLFSRGIDVVLTNYANRILPVIREFTSSGAGPT